ncbi:MAG: N-acetyltransferase [Candidatus Parvarchaeota archaeon]|nr:N-acetyltransferase [Candidatus Rehaiarchaeum fermentans]MCW1292661.1 N-acetyltransferase [Candidatus Rehaiarchaeum fermentans]MCW1293347.1 N-acetyltransferase [Candidatus Rehaiarchaeum fermentans]
MEIKGEGEFFVETPHGKAFVKYKIEANKIIIYQTFTPEEERGKGIATELTKFIFDIAKKLGYEIVDECSFTTYFKTNIK